MQLIWHGEIVTRGFEVDLWGSVQAWHRQVESAKDARLLGHVAGRVAHALADCWGPHGIHPSMRTLAKTVGCCRETVSDTVARLVEIGMLRVDPSPWRVVGKRVRRGVHRYTLLLPPALPARTALPKPPSLQKVRKNQYVGTYGLESLPTGCLAARLAAKFQAEKSLAAARRNRVIHRPVHNPVDNLLIT